MKKRIITYLTLLMLVGLFLSSFVSARSIVEDLKKITEEISTALTPIASSLLGETPGGEWLFAKVLFFIIIFAIVWAVLNKVEFFTEHTWVLVVISIAVSILATRWIGGESVIRTIILPYSTLGIAIAAGLPFVIYFLLVDIGLKDSVPTVRRIAWLFFMVIFIGLWFTRYDEITTTAIYVYPITALLAFLMAVFDGTIRRFFVKIEQEKIGKRTSREAITELQRRKAQLSQLVTDGIITPAEAAKREREYNKKISFLSK